MKSDAKKIIGSFMLIVYLFIMVFPMIYLISTSFMTDSELSSLIPTLIPSSFQLDNYLQAISRQPLFTYMANSLIVSLLSVAIAMFIGVLAAYGLVRYEIKLKKVFLLFILAISLLPTITLINPLFKMYSQIGLLNSRIGLSLIIAVLDLPMIIWFMTAAIKEIPISIEESAELDGATLFQTLFRIIFPLLKSSFFSLSILVFIGAWNNYLLSQVLNQFESARTVVVGMTLYQTDNTIPFGIVSAAALVTVMPLLIMVTFFQKNILGGIMQGGVKE
ncbi:carbohydrate ABC transporter permease [Enterococcus sp. BWB1-3]|uniref:carbohydrate ABC transporter permease n=1 Tax=unclassified Enterococcus TaxID=2608891 RepID=UPI00192082E9|nr:MULTISPECIES: carbohydrate ABC transporter permease [unclassified Enterococcus]MBL1229290.1 carbohydrate ABC transporter permease [Enterococcus sp. BWB1-3]MCB5951778.1 carbohydrate ABC transporter permease [Enterococcus sp. BWT-B8]